MKRKPALVEWDVTGDQRHGFGAIVYRSAAPMIVVKEIPAEFATRDDVASAVGAWIRSVPDQYRLNREFERFKATLRRLEAEGDPGMDENARRGPLG